MKDLPYVSESLFRNSSYVTSRLVRSDRQIADSILTDVSAQGDIAIELVYKGSGSGATVALDDMLRASLFSGAWSAVVTNSGTYSATSGVIAKTSGTNPETGLAVGDWVRYSRSTLKTYHVVTAVDTSGHTATLLPAPADIAATASSEIEKGAYIKNGTTTVSFSIEKEYVGLTTTYARMLGMEVNSLSLNAGIGGPVSGSIGFIGQNETSATSSMNTGTELTPTTNRVFNAVSGVKQFMTGTSLASLQIQEWGFDLRNNLRPLTVIGTLGAIQVGSGVCDVTGKLMRYFDSTAEFTSFLADTETQIAIAMEDPSGNAFLVSLPGIVYTSGKRVGGGISTDIKADFTWQARASTRYSTAAETIRIVQWDV